MNACDSNIHIKIGEVGYVYILTNESFREDWVKIGKSARPVNLRSKELDNTAVPLPFSIYATLATKKYNEVEKLVHKTIDRLTDLRIRQNREFFNVPPEVALDIFRDIAKAIDDAVVTVYQNNQPIADDKPVSKAEHSARQAMRPPFHFSMIGLKVGTELTFSPTGIKVTVAGDRQIEYEGRLWSLSAFVAAHLPESKRNTSNAYQGPKYFTYQGLALTEWRRRIEKEHSASKSAER